ncbi:hypothetical protein Nepgr_013353 [Nepenthes gracilis]|uniref:Uncharacterized protein n=1 Tax=Nepenthes gracilis TaxID=150966 RepID=A0AAD3SHZ4_NEPGR|nr:hypothetical protein Nepgr_013353 [Nepenthes gracilis]
MIVESWASEGILVTGYWIQIIAGSANIAGGGAVGAGYKPPTLHELEHQNRLKARRFYPKKYNRMAPYAHAPRNTTSFIIRAKKWRHRITCFSLPCDACSSSYCPLTLEGGFG